ncbi:chord-domain-containing protein [Phellopilus nigrolimitatus]|nr:chord-domain-containing protein [Phellopilus nigrolimitatus]
MPVCTRNGCKKEFSLGENKDGVCTYHPGAPVFHEGLKSWSCCSDVNKPELDFDEFMKIGVRLHTTEGSKPDKPKDSAPVNLQSSRISDGKEIYTTGVPSSQLAPGAAPKVHTSPPVEEEDDPTISVTPGTHCRRKGCGTEFVSDEESRSDSAVCTYHPSPPIFHEGSKGYLCCKRRVLEFDEFLKIEGCKKGRHLFAPKKTNDTAEVQTNCGIDHYQTPLTVCVSIFAKQTDRTRSIVNVEENKVDLDLFFLDSKRFTRSLNLFGPIIPEESKYTIMGTKVELILKKKDNRSWNLLEKTEQDLGGFNLTFGVGGRTGTIGSRVPPVLAKDNSPRV